MKAHLLAREVSTTPSMNKKEISFIEITPAEFHPPVVNSVALTLFQGLFHKRINIVD